MSTTALAPTTAPSMDAIERVLVAGDLSKLTPDQRLVYLRRLCDSLGLNPLTQPFEYITLKGKLTLYARKSATDQLRTLRGISIDKPEITYQDEWIIVTVSARDAAGRTDSDIGVVSRKDMGGDFGNCVMKGVTKAKRRVTLSLCGLGMLDETEVESIPGARALPVDTTTGEIIEAGSSPNVSTPELTSTHTITEAQKKRMFAIAKAHGWTIKQLKAWFQSIGVEHSNEVAREDYDDVIAHLEAGAPSEDDAPAM